MFVFLLLMVLRKCNVALCCTIVVTSQHWKSWYCMCNIAVVFLTPSLFNSLLLSKDNYVFFYDILIIWLLSHHVNSKNDVFSSKQSLIEILKSIKLPWVHMHFLHHCPAVGSCFSKDFIHSENVSSQN